MPQEPEAVHQVREWRRKVYESWQGKSRDEILKDINESGRRMQEEIEAERSRLHEKTAPKS